MSDILANKKRKAKKAHTCDLCEEKIEPGETYAWQKFVWEGSIYEWHTHERCDFVAGEIWRYADPDDGMSSDLFMDSCQEVCQTFVCPDCPRWDKEYEGCENDESYCIDRMYDFFQENELYCAGRYYGDWIWKSRRKDSDE